jgi:hypothetical protein
VLEVMGTEYPQKHKRGTLRTQFPLKFVKKQVLMSFSDQNNHNIKHQSFSMLCSICINLHYLFGWFRKKNLPATASLTASRLVGPREQSTHNERSPLRPLIVIIVLTSLVFASNP